MKTLVTGGAGFIGSHLAEELAIKNEVVIIDDLSTGRLENIRNIIEKDNVNFIRGNVTDSNFLKDVFNDVDYVFHHAAITSVPQSIENPSITNQVNLNGTLNVLTAARDAEVKKVIYASSSAVYGDSPESPKKENMNPNPLSPYAITKLAGEYYCNVFDKIYGLKTISLRYFNVFGPRQDPKSEYAAVIPKFITSLLNNLPPTIYGDGEQSRDFVFVEDVVHANLLAMENNATGVFNIASGKEVTINELVCKINEVFDEHIEPMYALPRTGDIKHSFADISKAKIVLSYEPKYRFEDGLSNTIKYFKSELRS